MSGFSISRGGQRVTRELRPEFLTVIYEDRRISDLEHRLLSGVVNKYDGDCGAWPSRSLLCFEVGRSRWQVDEAMSELRKLGYVRFRRQYSKSGRMPDLIEVYFPEVSIRSVDDRSGLARVFAKS